MLCIRQPSFRRKPCFGLFNSSTIGCTASFVLDSDRRRTPFAMCSGSAACSEISFAAGAAAHKDINAKRREYLFAPPLWLQSLIVEAVGDLRDIPVAFLLSNILLLTLPAASIVLLGPPSHLLGAAYLITNYALLFPRFVVSLLHVTEHRRLFKQGKQICCPWGEKSFAC